MMSNEEKLNRIVNRSIPKDELGKLACGTNWPALPFKCTRATPLLLVLVRPPPGSEALASELDTTVRERILALRVDLMDDAVFESDETSWEIKSTNPETGEEEFVLMRGNIEIRLGECDEDALQQCLSDVASSAQRRFDIRLEHQGREEIRIIDAWQTLLRHPRSAHSASARVIARAPRECSPKQCRRGCSNFEERSVARSRLLLEMIPGVAQSGEEAVQSSSNITTTDTQMPQQWKIASALLPASDGGRNGTTETQVKPRTTNAKTRSKKRKEKKRTERDQHAAAGADAQTTEPSKSGDLEPPYVSIHVSAEYSHE